MKPTDIFEIMDMAKRAREKDEIFNPLFSGAPGLGKSQIVQQWAKKNNYPLIDLRPAYLEAPDMIGFPSVEIVNGRQKTVHNTPDIWPDEETQPYGVLLLEEVNRAQPSVMNTLMQLLTDRKIHKYTLPKGWIIASCINPESSEVDVNSMDAALRDRFEIFPIEYDKKSFVEYMKSSKWDPSIIMFVESNTWGYKLPEDIGNVEGAKYNSPRTLSKLNTAVKVGVSKELELSVYSNIVGSLIGGEFYKFKNNEIPVTYEDLLSKKEESLQRLRVYSDPKNYKSAQISVTFRSILEEGNITDELLAEVCLAIPADQAVNLVGELEFKRKDTGLMEKLVKTEPKLLKYFKYNLKKS